MTHPIRDYIGAAGDTAPGFAARLGVSEETLNRIMAGEESPEPALARRIVEATDGAVAFAALYGAAPDNLSDLRTRTALGDDLDEDLLKAVLTRALDDLAGSADAFGPGVLPAGAEAVANTYVAMARVTTRRGPDRLAQALRPVLEEILRESAVPSVPPQRLEQASADAVALYFQALKRLAPR